MRALERCAILRLMSNALNLPAELRQTFSAQRRLVVDHAGNELFVGLSRDESERLAGYWRQPASLDHQERRDKIALEEGHQRARIWWQRALLAQDGSNVEMSAEQAFEIGRSAWDRRRALSGGPDHILDFDKMIAKVPRDVRLAAVHGWLNAYDDEADRLRAVSRN
ncbi:hypothetical protein [Mesorhizobium sp. B1-1-8]|uniref:hypothetical protein n=1 Tax=Mesorhizobium sp. B1-1-8 TaxID=2589976 RepID=UPI00112B379D|nr:hypothetical protein [Mesorhizobium sp. B1-1-8]UCI10420.1 hypothetical protein FJ974_29325 [Mesorhizobium sp. B1-1-8]